MEDKKQRVPAFPDDGTWNDLVSGFKMDDKQANALRHAVRYALIDLNSHYARRRTRKERQAQIVRLKRFHTALTSLAADLADDTDRLALPFGSKEAITLWLGKEALCLAQGNPEVGQRPDYDRRSIVLKHPARVLADSLNAIKAPIDYWFGEYAKDKGGREPNLVRNTIIYYLADSAEAIIKKRATATAGGRFEKLCAGVLHACGIDTSGLEDAVERALKERNVSAHGTAPSRAGRGARARIE